MVHDLTEGNPSKVLWRFTLPLFISVIFQQMYNMADSVIAGKFAGEDALAAVGASYPITMIFMAIAIGSNVGCSVIISRLFGAKDYKNMKTAVTTTICACLVLSVVLTLGGLLWSAGLMELIRTPENIFSPGALYLRIYIGGFLFVFLYNVATGIFTSLGDSKTPLWFLIGSSVGNIFLDALFVAVFHWGVAGVAWATFIAQGIACILASITLGRRLKAIPTKEKPPLFSWKLLGQIAYIAVPSIFQQSFVSVGNLFVQRVINSYGSSVIAGYSAANKLNTFTITGFTTFGNGISSFTSQNIGAGKGERVKKGFWAGTKLAIGVAVLFFGLYFFGGQIALKLFLNDGSATAMEAGVSFLHIVSPFYLVIAWKLTVDGVLRGASCIGCFMATTFSDLILRVVLSKVFAGFWGVTGIWLSWPVGWSVAAMVSTFFYCKGVWKKALPKEPVGSSK